MNVTEILTLIISLTALLVTYLVFKTNQAPQIIAYATPHYGKQSFIQLHIKNIGNGIAENIKITSSHPIPRRAFGITHLNDPVEYFETGIFKHGIKIMHPNQDYFYDWGQYGGLIEALNDQVLIFEISYQFRFPLSLWKSRIKDISSINIRELEELPASTGDLNNQLEKIHKELEKFNKEFLKRPK
ncbi:hypothetical protein [Acinetobacter sp. YH12239]|uniref:hypothetical protein n=1 Tax=Acinetobacter sp. YH12239 TaxID=2601166 RepID=UPI0015D35056|nr:hypothetical protein [Acinetobacter sp. YH12239]